MSSSMSNASLNLGVLSASDTEPEINLSSGSQSDTDFEVVLVTRAIDSSVVSDSDSASLVSAPSDLDESSDDEHIFVQHIQSAPNTPRPPAVVPRRLEATPRPPVAIARPVIEDDSDSASDREDDLSTDYDSDSDADGSVVVHARARTVTATHSRLEALHSALGTAHSNGSTATIRPARSTPANTIRRSAPAGMHTPAITTNTIVGIVASVPLSPPTPSDDGDIPYAPFTAAPTAVAVPVPMAIIPVPALATPPLHTPVPSIPTARNITRRMWTTMNTARMRLGLWPLKHSYREQLNLERRQAAVNPLVAPPPTAGRSPVSSEDEAPRQRISLFSPVNDMSVHNDSPDEEAYDDAIRQLDEHMTSPPEHPTAAYRYLLNRALLLEFRVCTPETLPTSHGAAIAMVKANVHINVLDYVAKRKEGFSGLRSVMLANAKTLRKDVKKRRMPAKTVKSLGLHSLLIHN